MIEIAPWSGLVLHHEIAEGARNEVWRGELRGTPVAVRRSRRSPESLAWELDLIRYLSSVGFCVPDVQATDDGKSSAAGIVVQRWIDGAEPSSPEDWRLVAAELQRLHDLGREHAQRPGSCAAFGLGAHRTNVDADIDAMPGPEAATILAVLESTAGLPTSVIHGDPDPSNLRITPDGQVGLLDWDESRVDVAWHDLSNLGIQVLSPAEHALAVNLSHAWEAVNGWVVEPDYARRRLAQLEASLQASKEVGETPRAEA